MSAFRDPVGSQPKRVYWRRRILVLLGALAVIAVIVLIVVRPATPSTPASVETSAPPAEAAPTDPSASAPSSEPQPCAAEQIAVTAVTDADSYAADVQPQLSWTLVNNGSVACTMNLGTSQQVFTVSSGDETIWTSSDCQDGADDFAYTVEPGAEPVASSSIAWDRTWSSPDTCGGERQPVTAGGASYHLSVSVGGVTSADTKQFLLQ
ncbi:hypothetical protein [Herbiconiux sp. L3-i23]|uniref:hypothetical protein n=1 Tax=Herbiconiux sp. L3-i23 TaxID=2905871 RepID=UPI0020590DC9|nr:hypothetical protein [Herbiconiux sp. L3-i23]BDI23952.1 hypothetical protein L3i23_27280 [Herbiconiux sp. L3-i23]